MNRSCCSSCGWLDRFGRLPLLPLLPSTNNQQTTRSTSWSWVQRSFLLACRQAMQLRCEVADSEHAALIDERHWFAPAASSSSTLASSPPPVSPSSSASSPSSSPSHGHRQRCHPGHIRPPAAPQFAHQSSREPLALATCLLHTLAGRPKAVRY